MKTISRKLLETTMRVGNAASKDETRSAMLNVHLIKKGTAFQVSATTGTILVRETVSNDSSELGESDEDTELLLSAKDLKKLKKPLQTFKDRNDFEVEVNESGLTVKFPQDLVFIARSMREYPRLDHVIPSKDKMIDPVSVSFNPELLSQIYDALKSRKTQYGVTLTFSPGTLNPILVSAGESDQIGVLMPCKM